MQTKLTKLLKSLAKKEPEFITLFDCDNDIIITERTIFRTNLMNKHQEISNFELKNNCSISVGPFSFVVLTSDKRFLAYYRNGAIEVEQKQF
jgi:hypothetical protein